nr:uncharacterized protein LOC111514695 [Leptinotarsa decemlineata]
MTRTRSTKKITNPLSSPQPEPSPSPSFSSEPPTRSPTPETQNRPTEKILNIRDIPETLSNQKTLYNLLNTTEILRGQITELKVNYKRTALLKTTNTDKTSETLQKIIRQRTGDITIKVIDLRPNIQTKNNTTNTPHLSYVIKGVDLNITEDEIIHFLDEEKIHYIKLWRIISRRTGNPTPLIRIITNNKDHYSKSLTKGISIYGRTHECEASNLNPVPPIPKYCSICSTTGHQAQECPTHKTKCSHCGEAHTSTKCTKINNPVCPNCSGEHPAYSLKCPKRATQPENPKEVAPVTIKEPTTTVLTKQIETIIKLQTTLLLNILPDRRTEILTITNELCKTILEHTIFATAQGNKIEYVFTEMTPETNEQ